MKKLYILTLIIYLFFTGSALAQVVYNGNGNSGFGSPIGNSTMSFSDDGTIITVTFTKGTGNFNDTMVMYIDNGSGGRNAITGDVNDAADSHRRAISNTGSGDLTFPSGFEATHAIAINTIFGGLWSIPSSGIVGNDGLGYIDAVGMPATSSTASFSFSFNWSEIGLTSLDNFPFVVTYGNPNDGGANMYSSNEGYGTIVSSGNPALSAFSFSSVLFYPSGSLGINDFESNLELSLYPNPTFNSFTINKALSNLKIFDVTGKLVKSFSGAFSKNEEYDISNLNQGLYLVKIENNGSSLTTKLIKI